jgi:hypothetical protein
VELGFSEVRAQNPVFLALIHELRLLGILRSSPRKYQISLICVMRLVADAC